MTAHRNGKGSQRRQETPQERVAYREGWETVFGSKRGPPSEDGLRDGTTSGRGRSMDRVEPAAAHEPGRRLDRVERGVLDEHLDAEAAEQARDRERLKAMRAENPEEDDDRTPIMAHSIDAATDVTPTLGGRILVDDDPAEALSESSRPIPAELTEEPRRPTKVESRTPNVYGHTTAQMDEHGHYPVRPATAIPATGTCAHVYGSGKRCDRPVFGMRLCSLHRDSL